MTFLAYLPLLLFFVGLFLVVRIISAAGPTTSSACESDRITVITSTDRTSASTTAIKTWYVALFLMGLILALSLIAYITDHQQHAARRHLAKTDTAM